MSMVGVLEDIKKNTDPIQHIWRRSSDYSLPHVKIVEGHEGIQEAIDAMNSQPPRKVLMRLTQLDKVAQEFVEHKIQAETKKLEAGLDEKSKYNLVTTEIEKRPIDFLKERMKKYGEPIGFIGENVAIMAECDKEVLA